MFFGGGTNVYNILEWSKDKNEHEWRLEKEFKIATENGDTFNTLKCKFGCSEREYEINKPFKDYLQCMSRFSTKTSTLRDMLKKDSEFCWQEYHDISFNKLKNMILTEPVLKFLDVSKNVGLSGDASVRFGSSFSS